MLHGPGGLLMLLTYTAFCCGLHTEVISAEGIHAIYKSMYGH